MITAFIIILVIIIVCLLAALYLDFKDIVAYCLFVVIIISMGIGFELNDIYTVKKPLVPSLQIECNNGKCDTSYVYKLNR